MHFVTKSAAFVSLLSSVSSFTCTSTYFDRPSPNLPPLSPSSRRSRHLATERLVSSFAYFGKEQQYRCFGRGWIGDHHHPRPKQSSLHVLIYGWDGDDEDECSTEFISGDESSSDLPTICSPVGVALAESIQTNPDKVGTLARLAVAFSPPERCIELDAIEDVHIMCVNERSIELEAVLCESHGCVSLYVPVAFPHDCGPAATNEILENCVLDNLHYLELEADNVLSSMIMAKKVATEKDIDDECRDLEQQLYSSTTISRYPNWWVAPENNQELIAECDNDRRLLNDAEFQNDVLGLARKGLEALGLGGQYTVRKAIVTEVGPAGLCVRCICDFLQDQGPSSGSALMDVPLPFGGEPRRDPESLRAAILGEVAAASVL